MCILGWKWRRLEAGEGLTPWVNSLHWGSGLTWRSKANLVSSNDPILILIVLNNLSVLEGQLGQWLFGNFEPAVAGGQSAFHIVSSNWRASITLWGLPSDGDGSPEELSHCGFSWRTRWV